MKQKLGTGIVTLIAVIAVAIIAVVGWRTLASSGTIEVNEEATFREAERKAKANGVDLRTIPEWAPKYYKYHPEEKPANGVAATPAGAPAMAPPPGPGSASGGGGNAPSSPPVMNVPPPPPGGR